MNEINDVEYLEYIVRGIVNVPDAVSVERTTDDRGVLMSIRVDQSDMAIVIGRAGAVAQSLRTLMRIVGKKSNALISVKVLEPEGGVPQ